MPIKLTLLLKRRPDMSHEAFRKEYEAGHSQLSLRYFGHLWTSYRRNYLGAANSFIYAADPKSGGMPAEGRTQESQDAPYDVVTEVVFPDAAALAESNRIASEVAHIFAEDEKRLFDRENCWVIMTDTVEQDLTPYRK